MQKKFFQNAALSLIGIVSMIGLGWVAAKIAGPPSPTVAQGSPSSSSNFFHFFKGNTVDLSAIRIWEGKYPSDLVNGHTLFDDPGFIQATNATMGEKLYQKFRNEEMHASKFLTDPIILDGQVLRVHTTNLAGNSPFEATIFINTSEGFADVYWNETDSAGTEHSEMLLHSGEHFAIDTGQPLSDIKYAQLSSLETYTAYLKGEQSKFVGKWYGSFEEPVGGSRLSITRTITVTGDPSKPNGLRYRQDENMQVNRGLFTCTQSNTLNRVYEGVTKVAGNGVQFYAESYTNKNCTPPPVFSYKLENGLLLRQYTSFSNASSRSGPQALKKLE